MVQKLYNACSVAEAPLFISIVNGSHILTYKYRPSQAPLYTSDEKFRHPYLFMNEWIHDGNLYMSA